MSPYSSTLAHARLEALETLVQALKDAETPDEKRRCAVAIFNAPDPCDLDDTIEFNADDEDESSHDEREESDLEDTDNSDSSHSDCESASHAIAPGPARTPDTQPARADDNSITPPREPARHLSIEHMNAVLDAAGIPRVSPEEAEYLRRSGVLPSTP